MKSKNINRREFLRKTVEGSLALSSISFLGGQAPAFCRMNRKKVIVLGIDGMDQNLLRLFVRRGGMPAFKSFMENHHWGPLQTTTPPQSPVAWSSFITGSNPGVHGIFDFVQRDVTTLSPFMSISRSFPADKKLTLGSWSIPLETGSVQLLRKGTPFWSVLEEQNIPVSLFQLPANFPVQGGNTVQLSGLGTPDLLGTYGTFTYYTDAVVPGADTISGGRVVPVQFTGHEMHAFLEGPANSLRTDQRPARIPLTVSRDAANPVARIKIGKHDLLMNQGEWSGWLPVTFDFFQPFVSVHGIIRLYLQQVHPEFRLYISPINIDPEHPNLPISNPADYAKEIAEAIGPYYTQGFPADTKALSNSIFSSEEYLVQSKIVLEESLRAFDYSISRFNEGVYFFYFSSIDQNSHMLLRNMWPDHPLYEPGASPDVKNAIYNFYCSMDDVLKQVMGKMDGDTTLIILSDHGFAPFIREFHASTWLVENGFTAVTDPARYHESKYYECVDWKNTRAYAMGLNGIYINAFGREVQGSVFPREIENVKAMIMEQLMQARDPGTGQKIFRKVYDTKKCYHGPEMPLAPDIVLGYESGYRISDEAALGSFPGAVVGDRTNKWSSDHCMDPGVVPGVLLANLDVKAEKPGIWDLAPTILKLFSQKNPNGMDGTPVI